MPAQIGARGARASALREHLPCSAHRFSSPGKVTSSVAVRGLDSLAVSRRERARESGSRRVPGVRAEMASDLSIARMRRLYAQLSDCAGSSFPSAPDLQKGDTVVDFMRWVVGALKPDTGPGSLDEFKDVLTGGFCAVQAQSDVPGAGDWRVDFRSCTTVQDCTRELFAEMDKKETVKFDFHIRNFSTEKRVRVAIALHDEAFFPPSSLEWFGEVQAITRWSKGLVHKDVVLSARKLIREKLIGLHDVNLAFADLGGVTVSDDRLTVLRVHTLMTAGVLSRYVLENMRDAVEDQIRQHPRQHKNREHPLLIVESVLDMPAPLSAAAAAETRASTNVIAGPGVPDALVDVWKQLSVEFADRNIDASLVAERFRMVLSTLISASDVDEMMTLSTRVIQAISESPFALEWDEIGYYGVHGMSLALENVDLDLEGGITAGARSIRWILFLSLSLSLSVSYPHASETLLRFVVSVVSL